MDRLPPSLRKLVNEGELLVLALLLVLLGIFGTQAAMALLDAEESGSPPGRVKQPLDRFGANAFRFLDEPTVVAKVTGNADLFAMPRSVRLLPWQRREAVVVDVQPKVPDDVGIKPPVEWPKPPTGGDGGVAVKPPDPPPPKDPVDPPPPPQPKVNEYLTYKGDLQVEGQPPRAYLAYERTVGPRVAESREDFFPEGARLKGVRVISFDRNEAVVEFPGGERKTIRRGDRLSLR